MTRYDDGRSSKIVPAADVVAHPDSHPLLSLLSLFTEEYADIDAERRRDILSLAGSLGRVTDGGAPSPGTECRRMYGCLICMHSRDAATRSCADFAAVPLPAGQEGLNMVGASEDASPGSVVMLFTKGRKLLATTIGTIWSCKWHGSFARLESEQPMLQEAVLHFVDTLGLERWVAASLPPQLRNPTPGSDSTPVTDPACACSAAHLMVAGTSPRRWHRLAPLAETRAALSAGGRLVMNCITRVGECDLDSQAHIMRLLDTLCEGSRPGYTRWDTSPMGGSGFVSSRDSFAALPPLTPEQAVGAGAGPTDPPPSGEAQAGPSSAPGPRLPSVGVRDVGPEWAPVALFPDDSTVVTLMSAEPGGSNGMTTSFTLWHTTWPDRPYEATGEAAATAVQRFAVMLDLDGYGRRLSFPSTPLCRPCPLTDGGFACRTAPLYVSRGDDRTSRTVDVLHAAQQAAAGGRFMTLLGNGEIQQFPQSWNARLVKRLSALWASVMRRFEAGELPVALAKEALAPSKSLSVRLRFVAIIHASEEDPSGDVVISTPAELQAHARRPGPVSEQTQAVASALRDAEAARKASPDLPFPRTWNAFKADLCKAVEAERARKDALQQSLKAKTRR